jgi:flagellar protein FlaF
MAVAEIIGAAVGVLLLIIVAYVVVGSTLTAAETVSNAQKDITLLNEARLRTSISLNRSEISNTTSVLDFSVTNTGNEIISDFNHMDLYTWDDSATGYKYYTYDKYIQGTPGTWSIIQIENDIIHPNSLDPGEKMWIRVNFIGVKPRWIQLTTSNGVTAQTTIP